MIEAEKRKLDKQRQDTSLKNTFFNRYLLLRYSLATFFFGNLYWLLIQLTTKTWWFALPLTLLLFNVLACIEQFKLYGKTEAKLGRTKQAFQVQGGIQVVSLLVTLTPWFSVVFPIFADNLLARLFVFTILGMGLVLVDINMRRIQQITNKVDKAYLRFRQMEKSLSHY